MTRLGLLLSFCFGMFLGTSQAHAEANIDYSKVGKGYFWYEDPVRVDPEKEESPQKPPAAPPSEKPFSVEWVEKNYKTLLNKAINDPTPENVANFKYLDRFVVDQSQRFAETSKQVVAMDPFLDEENRAPTAAWANVVSSRQISRNKADVLKYLATQGGLWVFVDGPEKCAACKEYSETVVKHFAAKHGFILKTVSVSSPEGRAAAVNLRLKGTPTTVFAHPATKNYFVITQGLLSESQIEDRMIIAGNAYKLLPSEMSEKANPYSKDLLDGRDLGTAGADPRDPSAVMKNLRERISGAAN